MTLIQLFTAIADAIRSKKGTQTQIAAESFPTEITEISTGKLTQEEYDDAQNDLDDILENTKVPSGTITITENGTIDVTNYAEANVNVSGDGIDWSEIGYEGEPQEIENGYNHALNIKNNWTNEANLNTKFRSDHDLMFMPLVDTSNATSMQQMFNGCYSLIYVPVLNTSNVTDMSSMFSSCQILKRIPLLNASNVTNMSSMFNQCLELTEIPLFDTNKVTDMSTMFSVCRKLVTIPLLNTSNVTNMSSMFDQCSSLTKVPLLDTSKCTRMSRMFNGCSHLKEVPLLSTGNVTNMSNMFSSCSELTEIPLFDTNKVTDMSSMFSSIRGLSDNALNNILQMCANAVSYTSTKTLVSIGISKTYYQNRGIENLSNYQAFLDAGWTTGY